MDQYRLLRPLGRGASGSVYLARDEVLERSVALKIFESTDTADAAIERVLAEARAIARLRHPNIVVVHSFGSVDGRPYIASEYIPGTPLSEVPRPIPWRDLLPIAIGVARGLAAVHAAGLLHRDVKPSNVMLDEHGVAKLIDFGLAIDHEDAAGGPADHAETDAGDRSRTWTDGAGGGVAGTPRYIAPELWTGARHSTSSDVFAFGKLLARLLVASTKDDADPTIALPPDVPAAVEEVLRRCLADDASHRPRHAGELAAELEIAREACVVLRLVDPLPVSSPRLDAVRRSFERVAARPQALATAFYEELFAIAPELRARFPANLDGQLRKLNDALRLAVGMLDRPERLRPVLEELGARHVAYGVTRQDFDRMRPVLLSALARLDADAWNDELAAAWGDAWAHLLDAMRRGVDRQRASYSAG